MFSRTAHSCCLGSTRGVLAVNTPHSGQLPQQPRAAPLTAVVVAEAAAPAEPATAAQPLGRQRRRSRQPVQAQPQVFTVIQPRQSGKVYIPRGCDPAPGNAAEQQSQQPEPLPQQQDRQVQAKGKSSRRRTQTKQPQQRAQNSRAPSEEAVTQAPSQDPPALNNSGQLQAQAAKPAAKPAARPAAKQPDPAPPGLQQQTVQVQRPHAAALGNRQLQHQQTTAAARASAASAASPAAAGAAAAGAVSAALPASSASTGDTPKPAWALSVDRRVASLPSNTRAARNMRWQQPQRAVSLPVSLFAAQQGIGSSSTGSSSSSGSNKGAAGPGGAGRPSVLEASVEEFLDGGELSVEGEQQLCLAYQRFVQLQQLAAQPDELERLLQQQQAAAHTMPHSGQQDASPATGLANLLEDPAAVQREGLLAQQLLLQLYTPLLVRQVRRVRSPLADERELLAAARQGLLHAAARFDAARAGSGDGRRLYALAVFYIKNALRDLIGEYQTAVVRVPTHVRETAAKLHRVRQQLQQGQPGVDIPLAAVAAAAGVGLQQAERAVAATSGALNALSLQNSVDKDKEDRGKAGSGVDLQQVDVSMEEDSQELSGVVGAGGLAAARSGLQQELDLAAEQAAVDALLQGFMAKLSPQDRELLALKLEGGNISRAARDVGKTKQWGQKMVGKVLARLRDEVRQQAEQNAELAALLSSRGGA